MSRTRLVVVVDINGGEIESFSADFRDPLVMDHPAASGHRAASRLRFPKAHALRAAIAQLVTAARQESTPCIP